MPSLDIKVAVLQEQFKTIEEYMREGREWRDHTSIMLTKVISQQENYQKTCEQDRAEQKTKIERVSVRVTLLELAKSKDGGIMLIIGAIASIITTAAISFGAALLGKGP